MSNQKNDHLFQLIKALSKSEKRQFKLFSKGNKHGNQAKFIKLFDILDRMSTYNEDKILKKDNRLSAIQLPNLKSHLYKQILLSLRSFRNRENVIQKIKDTIENAKILHHKCLYKQSQKLLKKARLLCEKHEQHYLLIEIISFEKRLSENLIDHNVDIHSNQLIVDSNACIEKITRLESLSNLSLKLYLLYLQKGFVKDHKDYLQVNSFFYSTIPSFNVEGLGHTEQYLFYSSLVRYHFFVQEPERALEYSKKCLSLFENTKEMIEEYPELYIKSLNHHLAAQYKLQQYGDFANTINILLQIGDTNLLYTEHLKHIYFKYTITHQCNLFFLKGNFAEGIVYISHATNLLTRYEHQMERHHLLVLYYKFSCMYFGAEDYKRCNFWLNKIINMASADTRNDILCFARILSLICHYELKNDDLIDYAILSTYRFLIKKNDLYEFQKIIMKFIKNMAYIKINDLIPALKTLREKMLHIKNNPYERRAFQYFDIISWLESKIYNIPIATIIQKKVNNSH